MSWLCVTHVRRHHQHYRTRGGGHLYQGRFKSFPVQDDGHLLTLLRYVEANAVRARLVRDARRWRWCSLCVRHGAGRRRETADPLLPWPIDEPDDWLDLVHAKPPAEQLERLRESVNRGRPWGDPA
jgi:putative transposase